VICAVFAASALRPAHADPSDAEIIGLDPGWQVEDVQLRTSYLDQRGAGFQSQGGAVGTPGSESMYIIQPSAFFTIRQSARVVHTVAIPLDAITAASPDAVDATTSASRRNTAGDFDLRSAIKVSEHDTFTTRVVVHAEEWLGGGTIGAGWRRSFADDNATLAITGSFGADVFDNHDHFGDFLGKTARETTSLNLSASQLLSPTTVIDGSYGVTYQHGTLRTGWNAVPTADGMLTDEVLPRDRVRHAASVRIAQHIPLTRSTIKARYRAYLDDFGLHAHTVDASVYQYLASWLYVRGGYRYHRQTSVDFFTTALPAGFDDVTTLRTADSDLAALHANEVSFQVSTVRDRGPLAKWSVSAELLRYQRSNDLRITAVSFGIGKAL
jgi:hypothetical protein